MAVNVRIIGILILLSHESIAKPQPDVDITSLTSYEEFINHAEEAKDINELKPKEQLFFYFIKEYNKTATYFQKASTQLVESCLKDDRVLKSEDVQVQQFKERLDNYRIAAENVKKVEDRINLVELFYKFVAPNDLDKKTDPTESEKLIARVLDEHGLEQLNHDFGLRFFSSLENVVAEYAKYANILSEEELKMFKIRVDFIEKFKGAETDEDKIKVVFGILNQVHYP